MTQSLAELEQLCNVLYNSHNPNERQHAEEVLRPFSTNVDYIPQCKVHAARCEGRDCHQTAPPRSPATRVLIVTLSSSSRIVRGKSLLGTQPMQPLPGCHKIIIKKGIPPSPPTPAPLPLFPVLCVLVHPSAFSRRPRLLSLFPRTRATATASAGYP